MTIDPAVIFAGLATALMSAYGIEIGIAFLMRGSREATGAVDDR